MPRHPILALALMLATGATSLAPSHAQSTETAPLIRDAADQRIDDFRWDHRLLMVFADSPGDPAFSEQMRYIDARPDELLARDLIVLTDTAPDGGGPIRAQLRPRGFSVVLIDKDGIVNQRKPFPQDVRELIRAIDKMPVRMEEIRRQRFGG